MGKEKLIPLVALIMLILGATSTVYVYATQIDTDTITINNIEYTVDQIFYVAEPRTFDSLEYSGVALDDLILKTGIACAECHEYNISGDDGYQKTVQWENMQNGLLTNERKVIFTDLPKAFRVKNVITIEVV